MDRVLTVLAGLPPVLVLVLVVVLPALESSTLLGLVVPGELTVLVGGVVAHAGGLPLWAVIAAATLGAAVGDQVGYRIGRHYGPALLARAPRRLRRSGELDRARALIARRGAGAVLVGRWVAVLRALVPTVAGISGMRRSTFTVANVTGALLWAATVAVTGYLGAASYRYLEQRLRIGGEVLLAVAVVAVVGWVVRRRAALRARSRD
ncbi:DedA family protein [Micromonospora cathayae]|uniref:DedA family protein n=1 Tax=Micromonospora cathayae TaxID=3028804 RepID=A0ABY7ZK69_9ACTN|nr:DedA family protein [Micromonospora sp. HUAS 3]WDZ83392.1 DedA family protein [Micromonospora sp. HUAS 3]